MRYEGFVNSDVIDHLQHWGALRIKIVLLIVDLNVDTVGVWAEHSMLTVSRLDEGRCLRDPGQATL